MDKWSYHSIIFSFMNVCQGKSSMALGNVKVRLSWAWGMFGKRTLWILDCGFWIEKLQNHTFTGDPSGNWGVQNAERGVKQWQNSELKPSNS
jgi:hypothetical protein